MDNLSECSECKDMVASETLVKLGYYHICEPCWDKR